MNILLHGWVYQVNELDAGDVRWLSRFELRKLLAYPGWLRDGVRQAAQGELRRRGLRG